MQVRLTYQDRKRIREGVLQKYSKAASGPEGYFQYPVGRAGLEGQSQDPHIVRALPDTVASLFCGVGNPFSLGPLRRVKGFWVFNLIPAKSKGLREALRVLRCGGDL